MKLKFYLIIICLIVFGCKKKISYEGILIHRNDLPFRGYNMSYAPDNDIYLQTSKKDSNFPDGVRYYLIIPKDREYQNFKNNLACHIFYKIRRNIFKFLYILFYIIIVFSNNTSY